jgi:hypothetical protein
MKVPRHKRAIRSSAAKVEQDHPAEDEVEGAQVCRVGVVDVAEDSLDVRAQRFPSVVTPGASSIV